MKCSVCHKNEGCLRHPATNERICIRCFIIYVFRDVTLHCDKCGASLAVDDAVYQNHRCPVSDEWELTSKPKPKED